MAVTAAPAFDEGLIFSRSDGWETEWNKVVDFLFVSPGLMNQAVDKLRGRSDYSQYRDDFVNELWIEYRMSPDSAIGAWDPDQFALLNWLTSYNSLFFKWSHFLQRIRGNELLEFVNDDNDGILALCPDSHVRNSAAEDMSETALMQTLIANLDLYSQNKSSTRLTEQGALQNYTHLKGSDGAGIRVIVRELLDSVAQCNPGGDSNELLLDCHQQAQTEYEQKNSEYSGRIANSRKSSKVYDKYERKLTKNAYYQLFCPIRCVDSLKRLLNFSGFNAYKRPSDYRKNLLPSLLPEFKERLSQIENWNEKE